MLERYKKTIVTGLVVALAAGAVMVLCSEGSGSEKQESLSSKLSPGIFNDANFSGRKGGGFETGELFYRMILAILLVVALGVAAIYVSRRLLPKITTLAGKEIRIVETVHLGQRRAVHLIEVGGKRILIGSTNEAITRLAEVGSKASASSQQSSEQGE
jgi:flagellar biosynthetic protein FliO